MDGEEETPAEAEAQPEQVQEAPSNEPEAPLNEAADAPHQEEIPESADGQVSNQKVEKDSDQRQEETNEEAKDPDLENHGEGDGEPKPEVEQDSYPTDIQPTTEEPEEVKQQFDKYEAAAKDPR